MSAVLLVVIALASFRIWRLIAEDTITYRPRTWVENKLGHDHYLITLLTCPWCAGSWIAFGVTWATTAFVSVPLPVLTGIGAAALVGFISQYDEG